MNHGLDACGGLGLILNEVSPVVLIGAAVGVAKVYGQVARCTFSAERARLEVKHRSGQFFVEPCVMHLVLSDCSKHGVKLPILRFHLLLETAHHAHQQCYRVGSGGGCGKRVTGTHGYAAKRVCRRARIAESMCFARGMLRISDSSPLMYRSTVLVDLPTAKAILILSSEVNSRVKGANSAANRSCSALIFSGVTIC